DADSLDITSNLIVESLGVSLAELPGGEACLLCKEGAYELRVSGDTVTGSVYPQPTLVQAQAAASDTVVLASAPTPGNFLIGTFVNTAGGAPTVPAGWTQIVEEAAQVSVTLRMGY